MVRRIASQVHQQVSRLLRANYLQKEPVWYQAVLDNPPLTLPPKAPPPRTAYDKKPERAHAKLREHSTRPIAIYYLEDDIRRQFFTDHPFETFRPRTLVEADSILDPNPITGHQWTRLRQRGRNPTSEDAIQFALNLYQYHSLSLSDATLEPSPSSALCAQSTTLPPPSRSWKQGIGLDLLRRTELDEGALAARKRWKAIVDKNHGDNQWTKGEQYVRLWQEGARPNYMPSLTQATVEDTPESTPAPKPTEAPKLAPKKNFKSRRPRDFLGVNNKKP
ncbi:mitochondrial ribosomal protein S25-domain-containing protein [Pholiota molesta]|nr:mitochondrial ribosomal protein S25-domain-containing protein [Pholiota molesta]